MNKRDRRSGWKYAKQSGHENENCVKALLDSDLKYQKELMKRLGYPNENIISTSIGGLHETKVTSVLGKTTKSKTDLKIFCKSEKTINISIKKSSHGQVYFVKAKLFIEVYEKQFHEPIPDEVQRAICLFWAEADDATTIIQKFAPNTHLKSYALQLRHKSLNATTLKAYSEKLYSAMLNWFSDHIYNITKLSFAMGAAKNSTEWSEFIWYINLLGENNLDTIFRIEDICNAATAIAQQATYCGESNGGTTIQLPFGFVQWHQSQLQFHHSYEKICNLLK